MKNKYKKYRKYKPNPENLVDPEYDVLEVQCPNGHIIETTFNDFKAGKRCLICVENEEIKNEKSESIEDVFKLSLKQDVKSQLQEDYLPSDISDFIYNNFDIDDVQVIINDLINFADNDGYSISLEFLSPYFERDRDADDSLPQYIQFNTY